MKCPYCGEEMVRGSNEFERAFLLLTIQIEFSFGAKSMIIWN